MRSWFSATENHLLIPLVNLHSLHGPQVQNSRSELLDITITFRGTINTVGQILPKILAPKSSAVCKATKNKLFLLQAKFFMLDSEFLFPRCL